MLVENFGEGALTLSEDAITVYTNDYFMELLQLPYESVMGKSFFEFIQPESHETFTQLFRKGLSGQGKGEINLIAGKKIIPVYVSLTSLYPTLPNVGMIVTDISDKKTQENILKDNDEEIKKKAAQLEVKNIELEKMNKELESFAYISSHDLQEPLRKIQTFATRIMEKEFDNLSETGKDHFLRMQSAAQKMQTLIEDLLAYSRINTSQRVFETSDLNKIVDEVKEDLKEIIKEKQATIEVTGLGDVCIIPFQFRQLMLNLIGNALKFSKPLVPPHIIIRSEIADAGKLKNPDLSPETKYCHIAVIDNGIGFENQYSEKIFEVFQRLHGKTDYDGTGIGLSIVKKIVESHGGIITADGKPNKGATFDIYFPLVDRN
jgi:PAS domain S-box-containing protein